jgi:short-subunit dehydrogenase
MITGRDKAKLEKLVMTFPNTISIEADLKDQISRKKIIDAIQEHAPDLVINNAGFGLYGNVLDFTTQEQMEILEVNANALLEITIEAARTLVKEKKKGTILNIASAAAFLPFPAFSVYAAAKAFVKEFSESFDFELAPLGVRVLCACPGQVNTHFRKTASKESAHLVSSMAISTEKAVEFLWDQIENQVPVAIFDWRTRFSVYCAHLVPRSFLKKLLQKNILSRKK